MKRKLFIVVVGSDDDRIQLVSVPMAEEDAKELVATIEDERGPEIMASYHEAASVREIEKALDDIML